MALRQTGRGIQRDRCVPSRTCNSGRALNGTSRNEHSGYKHALAEIDRRSAARSGFIADPFLDESELRRNLQRTGALLAELDDPHSRLRIVHVAGSKGKASTATFIANILTDAGHSTGLFTSPHLHTFRERMTVSNRLISQTDFAVLAHRSLSAALDIDARRPELGPVNAFEILLAMALLYFHDQSCEVAVLEVGLGGRYDATNIVIPEVSVITSLELEHTEILGSTIEQIAWNKGGIIKSAAPVVSSRQEVKAGQVLQDIATQRGTPLLLGGRDWTWSGSARRFAFESQHSTVEDLEIALPGAHQLENAATAVASALQLSGLNLAAQAPAIRSALRRTALPGHFEVVEHSDRRIILDVAHTPAAMKYLIEAIREFDVNRSVVIAGFLGDKQVVTLISILEHIAGAIYLVPVQSPRTSTSKRLLEAVAASPGTSAKVLSGLDAAFRSALDSSEAAAPIVITGSSALVSEARTMLGLAPVER